MSTDQRDAMIERLARSIEIRGLEAPAIFFLEANRPFSFLGSQIFLLSEPILSILGKGQLAADWAEALQDRNMVERIIRRLETKPYG